MCEGALTIDGNRVNRNLAYYVVAQASKFVFPGSVRIGSTQAGPLSNTAFLTPEGKTVLIVANYTREDQPFAVQETGRSFSASLAAESVGTYVW